MKPRIRLSSSVSWRNAGRWAWCCSDGDVSGVGHTPTEAYRSWEFHRVLRLWQGLNQQNRRNPLPYQAYLHMGE